MGMIVEILAPSSMLVGGALLLWACGAKGWGVAPWGLAAGSFLTMVVGYVQVATPLTGSPVFTMTAVVALPAALWVAFRRRGVASPIPVLGAILAEAAVCVTVVAHRLLHTFTFHVDSMEYLGVGRLLVDNTYTQAVIPDQIDKRLIAVPLLHAPASLTGEYHLAGVTPVVAIATMALVAWLAVVAATPRWGRGRAWVFGALGPLVLVTMNRFDFHAVYLNGHLYVALGVLATAGASWLLVTRSDALGRSPAVVAALGCFALTVTRAEGPFLALAAIAPAVAAEALGRRTRAGLVAALGVSVTAWYGFATLLKVARGYPVDVSAPMTVLGLCAIGVALALRAGRMETLFGSLPAVVEFGLLGLLTGFVVRDPEILGTSVSAVWQNAYGWTSWWGISFAVITGLAAYVFVFLRNREMAALRMPVTMFLPIAIVLAYARGSAYRVAAADSLNRMLIEVVPIAVACIVVGLALGGGRAGMGRASVASEATARRPSRRSRG